MAQKYIEKELKEKDVRKKDEVGFVSYGRGKRDNEILELLAEGFDEEFLPSVIASDGGTGD